VYPRGTQKYLLCKGEISKEFFTGGKAKMTYFAGGKIYLPKNILIHSNW
jgi:hypothetical protein